MDTPDRIAQLALQLPPGARIWRAVGGWSALTPEEQGLSIIEHRQRLQIWQASGGKGKQPAAPEPPKGWLLEQVEEEHRARAWESKAAQWRQRNQERYAEMEKRAVAVRSRKAS